MDDLFTSESVSEGHPDKLADQISDAVLDAFLRREKESRLACETFLTGDLILVAGEAESRAHPSIEDIARKTALNAGYDSVEKGLDPKSCKVLVKLGTQSPDIQNAVGRGKGQGAGDQGVMFGYAVDETETAMPLSIHLAQDLMRGLAALRRKKGNEFLFPDAKSQVTVRYENGAVKDITALVISTQHHPDCRLPFLEEFIREELIKPVVPVQWLTAKTRIMVNPGGRFVVGGPAGDCGLTGRKIIVDTYGGHGAHGGGAFSGKDPSKVDRSAAYIARHIAKNLVWAGLARKCLIQLSYAIGAAQPVSVRVEDFGTSPLSRQKLSEIILQLWDLTPHGIIQALDLLRPIYLPTAVYGHFGRTGDSFTWERGDKVELLRSFLPSARFSKNL